MAVNALPVKARGDTRGVALLSLVAARGDTRGVAVLSSAVARGDTRDVALLFLTQQSE